MNDDMRLSLVYPPTCGWGLPGGPCGAADTRPYAGGHFCPEHAPWARTGQPEPLTPIEAAQRQEQ